MPAYTFYCEQDLQPQQRFILSSDETHHAIKVMRLQPHDVIELINGKGRCARAFITHADKSCEGIVECILREEIASTHTLSIVQGLTALNKADWIVEKLTELGADEIIFFGGDKSTRQKLNDHQLQKLTVKSINALKQCGRLTLPKLRWLEDLRELKPHNQLVVMSLEEQAASVHTLPQASLTAVIGPESGLSHQEIDWLNLHHALPISLHPHILRSETASIVACAFLYNHLK